MRHERLTETEQNDLHYAVNERRKGSTHIKVDAVALHHLLADYAELQHELHEQTYLTRGMSKLIP